MEQTLISIIIPCYNAEKYIEECLESVVNQTYKNLEIICINDGSTDKTLDKLKRYKMDDNRIKIIDKNNEGISMARNNALDIMSGEYYMYVDSDDKISIDCIELMEKEKTADNLVILNRCIWDGQEGISNCSSSWKIDKQNFKGFSVGAWSNMYSSSKKIYFIKGIIFEDRPHFIEILENYDKVIHQYKSTYFLRRESSRDDNITSKMWTDQECLSAWNEVAKYTKKYPYQVYKFGIYILGRNKGMIKKWNDKRLYMALRKIKNKNLNQKIISLLSILKMHFVIKIIFKKKLKRLE